MFALEGAPGSCCSKSQQLHPHHMFNLLPGKHDLIKIPWICLQVNIQDRSQTPPAAGGKSRAGHFTGKQNGTAGNSPCCFHSRTSRPVQTMRSHLGLECVRDRDSSNPQGCFPVINNGISPTWDCLTKMPWFSSQVKYFLPCTVPSFLPLASSRMTPTHFPVANRVAPT